MVKYFVYIKGIFFGIFSEILLEFFENFQNFLTIPTLKMIVVNMIEWNHLKIIE